MTKGQTETEARAGSPLDPGVSGLNPPQREAVLHEGGPLVVFAGAGSGKTRVITHRVAYLVNERGVTPWNILAVTFTNKAAQEMKERLKALIGASATQALWVGTFHATCARLLRKYSETFGVKRDFTIYDQNDSLALVRRVYGDFFSGGSIRDASVDPKEAQSRIGRAKQDARGPDQMEVSGPRDAFIRTIYQAYEKRLRAAGALDFGDLIFRVVVGLETNDDLRRELQGRFGHLLVDEFQDTNRVQYRLVRAIGAAHRNITVVGDDDQSIYGWRGADRRNITNFREEFGEARVIKLEQNYRSTARILRAANAIIGHASDRVPKELWTDNADGAEVTVCGCASGEEEAQLVVRMVRDLAGNGRSLEEMALFYRLHAQSRLFEDELRRHDVPYRIIGGMRFYDRAEVKDILAYLRVLSNPDDDVSCLRIVNTPPRGIGKKTVERLMERAAREGTGVFTALERESKSDRRPAKRLAAFRDLILALRAKLESDGPLAAVGYAVYEKSGYKKWLEDQDSAEADARHQNIQELLGAIQTAEEETEAGENGEEETLDLAGFLERVTLDSANEREEGQAEEKLTLMTVHSAKGLEFPVVAVAGMEEDTFPFRRRREAWADPLDDEKLEEERRLAYVAFTRAEELLVLTYATQRTVYGQRTPFLTPSRFLAELPPDDIRTIGSARTRRPSPPYRAARRPRRYTPPPRVDPGDSYVDYGEGSDFEGQEVHVGMRVRHRKFGVGSIVKIARTSPPRVDVEFDDSVRTIQVSYLIPA